MGLVKACIAALACALAAAPAAVAAYAPKLEIKLDPTAPNVPAAFTSTITQAAGETANKTVVVTFPTGFTTYAYSKVTPCTVAQQQSDSCPPESQVGQATAETALGSLTGPVYFESDSGAIALVVYLKGFGGLVSQKVIGNIALADGRVQTTFDNLPNTQTTSFQLALQGGDRALVLTSAKCGPSVFDASFTSQNDEKATAQATVDIEGCPVTPVISQVSVSPRKFRAVRKFSDTERPGYGTTLSWTLSEVTSGTRITVEKRVKKHWKRAGSFIGTGDQGANHVKWDGRIRKKPLAPGSYRFSIKATSKAGLPSKPVNAGFTIAR